MGGHRCSFPQVGRWRPESPELYCESVLCIPSPGRLNKGTRLPDLVFRTASFKDVIQIVTIAPIVNPRDFLFPPTGRAGMLGVQIKTVFSGDLL